MRGVRRADWFSIVATDLFCGALCAVIILDAVTPRGTRTMEGPATVKIAFDRPPRGCEDAMVGTLLQTVDGPLYVSTLHADDDGATCSTRRDIAERQDLAVISVVLAKGTTDVDVSIEDEAGAFLVYCSTGNAACQ